MRGPRGPRFPPSFSERNAWRAAIILCVVLALWPIWSRRFPPMQDYPQHLFCAHVLANSGNTEYDYDRFYAVQAPRGPYSAFFRLAGLFSGAVPLETAGKLVLSLYVLLVALMVARASRRSWAPEAPWGLLLAFAFVFNQEYYLGFVNWLLSLPLIGLVLLEQESLAENPGDRRATLLQVLWLAALFFTHPLSLLLASAFAIVAGLASPPGRAHPVRLLAVPVAAGLFLVLWISMGPLPEGVVQAEAVQRVAWLGVARNVAYLVAPFAGMRLTNGPEPTVLALWIVLLLALAAGRFAKPGARQGEGPKGPGSHQVPLLLAALCLAGVLLLPFRFDHLFTYVNRRLAVVAYFLLAMLAGRLRFRRWSGAIAGLLVVCLIVLSALKQNRISRETEEVLPLLQAMPRNASLLPLVFDNDSPELDPRIFDPHIHDTDYYHVLVGGGFSPYVFDSPLSPVRLRAGTTRVAPSAYSPGSFRWEEHAWRYDFFLLRGAPAAFEASLAANAEPAVRSGKWLLMRRLQNPGYTDPTAAASGAPRHAGSKDT